MKCKVCGSELTEGSLICKVCGSPIEEEPVRSPRTKASARPVEDVDFNWNTFDFPKPHKPQDIEMSWPQFNVHQKIDADAADEQIAASMASRRPVSIMRNDAQEGFVFTNAAPARPQPQVVPVVQYVPVQAVQPVQYQAPQPAQTGQYQAPQPAQAGQYQTPQPAQSGQYQTPQPGAFAPVWTMPAQQPMPAAEPLWFTQPVAAVTPQGIPVQYVPLYAQPAGPYTIAMQRADGQIPGMPTKAEFAAAEQREDDEPVDESWIKAQLEPVHTEVTKSVPVVQEKMDATEEPFQAFVFDEPENAAAEEVPAPDAPAAEELAPAAPVVEEPAPAAPIAEEPVAEESASAEEETAPVKIWEPFVLRMEKPASVEIEPEAVAPVIMTAEKVAPLAEEPAAPVAEPAEETAEEAPAPIREIAAEEKEAARADRFYTFNKKNEEFQALLDAEYARVKAMRLSEASAAAQSSAPVAPAETTDSKITDTNDISAAMASVTAGFTEPEEEEDDAPLTVDQIIKAGASRDPNATRIWTAEEEDAPVFKLPDGILTQPQEVQAEELSAFESMLMSGTSSRDETTDETIKINLSKIREAVVHPLAEDVTVPDFEDTEEKEQARKEEEKARILAAEKARQAEEAAKADEQRKAAESKPAEGENEQLSLRKQRLEEMARAREEFFGSSLTPVVKPSSEVGTIASRKSFAKSVETAAAQTSTEVPVKGKDGSEEALEKTETPTKVVAETENGADVPNGDIPEPTETIETSEAAEPTKKGKFSKLGKGSGASRTTDVKDDSYEAFGKEDYRRGMSKFVIFLLVIVVLALLLEGAKLMANRFLPESTISIFLTDLETDIVTAVTNFFSTVVEGFNLLFKK